MENTTPAVPAEADALELGMRAACWLAVASGNPGFMLARYILLAAPPRRRMTLDDYSRTEEEQR